MAKRDPACIFCRIVAREIPASYIHQGATATAFLDINPVTPGHLLVIPNDHHASLADTPVETWAHVMRISRRIAVAVRAGDVDADGVNLFVADGQVAGQEVAHVHVHVIPRTTADGFGIARRPVSGPAPTRDELDRQAEAIRAALGADR